MRLLITGTAGFIGFHLALRLLSDGHEIVGYDGLTPYYDVSLKRDRLKRLSTNTRFEQVEAMLEDRSCLTSTIQKQTPDVIIHLAAQAGVRYSLENPEAYVDSNLVGTFNLLEAARTVSPRHLLIASTSSVYGGNEDIPFREVDRTDFPVSLYAATKKASEAMSHSYAHIYAMPTTCFRFFTVYGPWGRPDMALFKFVKRMIDGSGPIEVYGHGEMRRDFTYIDDLVEGIVRLIDHPPRVNETDEPIGPNDSVSPVAPWRAVNIAGGQPIGLMEFIKTIEEKLGATADKTFLPMQQGDVPVTFADATLLKRLTGYAPSTRIDTGVGAFLDWYRDYYQVG